MPIAVPAKLKATPHAVRTRPWGARLWTSTFALLGAFLLYWGLSPSLHAPSTYSASAIVEGQAAYETRAIQNIREGDIVLSRDENGEAIGLKRVAETYVRTSDHLRILTFEAEDGTTQTLKTTDEHPFWLVNEGAFVEAEPEQNNRGVNGDS